MFPELSQTPIRRLYRLGCADYSSSVMFSSRADWDRTPNELARLRSDLVASGKTVSDLTESNPTRCGFSYPNEELLGALSDSAALSYEPDPLGLLTARKAVAKSFPGDIDPGRIVLTAGTSEAYSWLFKLLCEPGDSVLAPAPSYPLFEFLARLESVRLETYPLIYDGRWSIDFGELARKIDNRTRAVIVVNPNNPTGSYLCKDEIDALREICREKRLAVISDEVFFDFAVEAPQPPPVSLSSVADVLTFTLGGLSKMAALPQMKLSWIAVDGPAADCSEALERLELIGDTYLSVGTPVQAAASVLLEAGEKVRQQIIERIRANREFLDQSRSREAAWDCLRTEGGWSAVLRVPRNLSEHDWVIALLEKDGIYVHPGYFFDFPTEGYLALSLLPTEDLFRESVGRLAARIASATG